MEWGEKCQNHQTVTAKRWESGLGGGSGFRQLVGQSCSSLRQDGSGGRYHDPTWTQCEFSVSRTPKRSCPGQLGSWTQDQRDSMGPQMPMRGLSESPRKLPRKGGKLQEGLVLGQSWGREGAESLTNTGKVDRSPSHLGQRAFLRGDARERQVPLRD